MEIIPITYFWSPQREVLKTPAGLQEAAVFTWERSKYDTLAED
jgi:hypothetical protein